MTKKSKNTKLLELTLLLASALTILANAIVAPALPQITQAFCRYTPVLENQLKETS